MIADDLYSYVTGLSAFTDLIDTRFFPSIVPQEETTRPVLVYQFIDSIPDDTIDSAKRSDARVQFSAIADSYKAARDLADVVIATFRNFRGELVTGSGVVEAQIADLRDMEFDEPTRQFRSDVDVILSYPET